MSAPKKMCDEQMRAVLIAFAESEARKLGVDPTGLEIDNDLLLQVMSFAHAASDARDAQWQTKNDALAAEVDRLQSMLSNADCEWQAKLSEEVEKEREACALLLDESAIRLFGGRSRVSQVDRHVASVLRDKAKAIRARGEA